MTVKEFIAFLKKQPQDIQVAYQCYSEQVLLNVKDVSISELCEPRPDGWIQNSRPDMVKQKYLLLPGN